ncbi:N-acetyltransferase [Wenzhouxiangella sp. C33]|uniref:N-acetyltransferase n=2 Tax=Wenzhouxiangella limi TaxID=2707351 RepID=A0A845V222_9GAMM|nr:N-acetyltransferase [Wenzhouxiangella limi]
MVIRRALDRDVADIVKIYNYYIEHSTATFEEKQLLPEQLAGRMNAVAQAGLPWLLAMRQGAVVGYAYATPWRERTAYRHSVEVSGYVCPDQTRGGTGSQLYQALIERLERCGKRSLIGVVTLPNPASAAFHAKMGFVKVAHLEQVGFKFGRWLDVGYWQKLLGGG